MRLASFTMVTSPTGKGVIVMGGNTAPGEYSKVMFELTQSMQWTRLEQTLQIGHFAPLALPIYVLHTRAGCTYFNLGGETKIFWGGDAKKF